MRIVAATAATALLATGCGGGTGGGSGDGSDGGDVSLVMTFWGNDDRAQRYDQALRAFEEANPTITVQESFVDFPSYWPARATEAAGRSLPDVMLMDLSYLREFGANGALLDLGDAEVDLSGMSESLIPSGQVDGAQLGVPVGTNAFALFTDAAAVETTGVPVPEQPTWEDYNAYLAEVAAAGATREDGAALYGSGDYTGTFWIFIHWLNQQGIEAFSEDGELGFTQEDLVEWWGSVEPLRESGGFIPPERVNQLTPLSIFDAGEVTTEQSWDNFLAGYVSNNPDGDHQLQTIPADDPAEPGLFLKPSMLYSIGANTEHPEEAAALVDYLVNDPEAGAAFGTSQGLRASSTQRDAVELEGIDAQVAEYEESIEPLLEESPPPPVEGFGTLEARFREINENLNYRNISVEDAAEQWYGEAEQTLADNQ